MTDQSDDARDLLRRAYAFDPRPVTFDPREGLANLRARLTRLAGASEVAPDSDVTSSRPYVVDQLDGDAQPTEAEHAGSPSDQHHKSAGSVLKEMYSRDEYFRFRTAADQAEAVKERHMASPQHELPPDPVVEAADRSKISPYAQTGGRSRPSYDLAIEALISTSDSGWEKEEALLPEHRAICSLCMGTKAVAEVAAYLSLPIDVVRVLIGHMVSMGLVTVHSNRCGVDEKPLMETMERVLNNLRGPSSQSITQGEDRSRQTRIGAKRGAEHVQEAPSQVQAQDLTEQEQRALEIIASCVTRNGYAPSVREIGDGLGLTSAASVARLLRMLEQKGYLHRDPAFPRAVSVPRRDTDLPR